TPIADEVAATELGITVGQQILEVSKQKGKKNLDQGVVIQVIAAGNLPFMDPEPAVSTPSPAAVVAESEPVAAPEAATEASAESDGDTEAEAETETTADS
ncbi:MAG: hypothetical protein F6K30_20900, partial [Cyanothece sp. SIO2G6]|nr:hypothetical protein [Cyanothece sp. SIO2G6]